MRSPIRPRQQERLRRDGRAGSGLDSAGQRIHLYRDFTFIRHQNASSSYDDQ